MIQHIPYGYTCAGGWGKSSDIYLDAILTADEREMIVSKLDGEEFFIPGNLTNVKIAELQPTMDTFPTEDDHVFHVLDLGNSAELHEAPAGATVISAKAFVAAFEAIKGPNDWDCVIATQRLGL